MLSVNDDILRLIFQDVSDTESYQSSWSSLYPKDWIVKPVWILSQVCARWRSVAFTTPTLWSKVYIGGPYPKNVRYILRRQLEYATVSLDVRATKQHFIDEEWYTDHIVLFDMLLERRSIWREASVMDSREQLEKLLEVDGGLPMLPKLERLRVLDTKKYEGVIHLTADQAPNLRVFFLERQRGSPNSKITGLSLPWTQLRELELQGFGLVQDMEALGQLVLLERLSLKGRPLFTESQQKDYMSKGFTQKLPALRSLVVKDCTAEDLGWHDVPGFTTWFHFIFSTFIFGPHFRSLSLLQFPDHFVHIIVNNMEARGNCNSVELLFIEPNIHLPGQYAPASCFMFRHFPNLIEMHITSKPQFRRWAKFRIEPILDVLGSDPTVCPNLQRLELSGVEVPASALAKSCKSFFGTRGRSTLCTKLLTITNDDPEAVDELDRYRQEGKIVYLANPPA